MGITVGELLKQTEGTPEYEKARNFAYWSMGLDSIIEEELAESLEKEGITHLPVKNEPTAIVDEMRGEGDG